MRIISGKYGGRQISMDDKAPVRPTSDKARGALFSSIAALIPGGSFLDICAGSGAVGLEALSRGALHVTSIEQSPRAVELIRVNAENLGVDSADFEILPGDFRAILPTLSGRRFAVIFADPPYGQRLLQSALEQVSRYALLADEGIMVLEHFAREKLPSQCFDLEQFKVRKYGQTLMSFYRKGEQGNE